MPKFSAFLLIASTLLIFSSCLKIEKEYYPIGSVNLKVVEGISPDTRAIFLQFYTVEQFPCVNYFIRYDYDNNAGNLNINLKDIEKNDFCFTAQGPATAELNIGSYLNGTYQFNLTIGDAANAGILVVTPSRYILNFPSPDKLVLVTDTLNRIPENTFWGYVAYDNQEFAGVAQSVLDSLENRGAVPAMLIPGDFGYFTLDSDGKITLVDEPNAEYSVNFIYSQANPEDDIKAVIRYFYLNHYDEVYIFVRTSNGQVLTSDIR